MVSESLVSVEAPLAPDELARRWLAMGADPVFEDVCGKVELTEWGEILVTPVGKTHGVAAARLVETLHKALGGHVMVEVGILTAMGVRVPDVLWCSDAYFAAHPEDMPLSSAPELCVEIVSPTNPLPKLRAKAAAYVDAGAVEAWIVHPKSRQVEIYGREGRKHASSFSVDVTSLLG